MCESDLSLHFSSVEVYREWIESAFKVLFAHISDIEATDSGVACRLGEAAQTLKIGDYGL